VATVASEPARAATQRRRCGMRPHPGAVAPAPVPAPPIVEHAGERRKGVDQVNHAPCLRFGNMGHRRPCLSSQNGGGCRYSHGRAARPRMRADDLARIFVTVHDSEVREPQMNADNATHSAIGNVARAIVAMSDTQQESTLSHRYPRSSRLSLLRTVNSHE